MNERSKGILYVILAAFCFACMSLFVKLSGNIPTFEKSFFRNLVAIFFALLVMFRQKIPFSMNGTTNLKYLLGRSIGGTIGIFANFYAIGHLVIADANMLNKLSPFFAILFSYFLLKEKVRPYQMLAVILAFVGALFILKPGGSSLLSFPALIGMIGGMGAGFAYANVRLCSKHGVPGPFIVLFFSLFSCIASVPFSLLDYKPLSLYSFLCLMLAGLAATGGQFSITAAYSHAPAREVSVFDYSQILFATLLGILFLGEFPDLFSIIGYMLIAAASIFMFYKNLHASSSDAS